MEEQSQPRPTLREQLLEHGADLTPQQRVIADFVLDNLQELPFLSVPQMADRTGTSEATVVRFCQRIGYSGYSDLKMALVDDLRADGTSGSAAGSNADSVLAAMANLEKLNIDRTLESIDQATFGRVAAQLFKADHTFTFGLGISACLASFATYLLTEHGLRSTCLATGYTSPLEQLVVLRPSDTLLVFSLPPYSKPTLAVLSEARDRGIPTIVVTDRATSPAIQLANQSLVVSTHGMTLTNATSSVNVLLYALVVEIASRHRGGSVEAMAGINRILRDQRDWTDG